MWLPRSFAITLVLAVLGHCAVTNQTFDDSSASFTFTGTWNTITPSSPCDICSSKPDPSLVHDGTWHDGNYRNGAAVLTTGSFTFKGSAVYIFGIDQATIQPNILFTLDALREVHRYTGTEQFVYNALFFSATGLADETHTVNWEFDLADTGVVVQAALFDYAIVTSGEDTPPSTTSKAGTTELPTSSSKISPSSTLPSSTSSHSPVIFSSLTSQSTSISAAVAQSSSSAAAAQSSLRTITLAGGITTVTAETQADTSSRSRSSHLGAILGGSIGALAVATLAIIFLFYRHRRLRRIHSETGKTAPRSEFLRLEDYPLHTRQQGSTQAAGPRQAGASGSISVSYSKRGNMAVTAIASHLPRARASQEGRVSSPDSGNDIERSRPLDRSTSTRSIRNFEERLAMLEAQIADHQTQQPPPYVHENDR